jgi:hypothetical protein
LFVGNEKVRVPPEANSRKNQFQGREQDKRRPDGQQGFGYPGIRETLPFFGVTAQISWESETIEEVGEEDRQGSSLQLSNAPPLERFP